MKAVSTLLIAALAMTSWFAMNSIAQIDLTAYQKYLDDHKDMTVEDLLAQYPSGVFLNKAPTRLEDAWYFEKLDEAYRFTSYEKSLASDHGFMVTERLHYPTYRKAFYDVYYRDLPLYISSDAILHAVHRSYDNILISLERSVFIPKLSRALTDMRTAIMNMPPQADPRVHQAVVDADLYVTIARLLLNQTKSTPPIFSENLDDVMLIQQKIDALQMSPIRLFSETPRDCDFSQFQVRGHYTDSEELMAYFRCMMWLGRSEIYITKPVGADPEPTDDDIRRQCMLAVLLANLTVSSGADAALNEMDRVLSAFVGEQDNLTLKELDVVIKQQGISGPASLLDNAVWQAFQNAAVAGGGGQSILSQLLYGDPTKLNTIKPAAAFMLMGQRFLLDSYVMGNVVYDKVDRRLMPSPLDVMFVLGNDATAQLLTPEIRNYNYASNIAGLRYLTNSLGDDYWNSSIYTGWLSSIRSLSPPLDRSSLPRYMQTGAWWQKTLNTQLTSWTELRHDNLLYGKQSYTGGLGCYYPAGYVEPVPHFYAQVENLANRFADVLKTVDVGMDFNKQTIDYMISTLLLIANVSDRLESIANKELTGTPLNNDESDLFTNWLGKGGGCVDTYLGTYTSMMYGVPWEISEDDPDYVVADVHTQPTDEHGNMVGNVLHVGTGQINMALIIAVDPVDQCTTAYVGPVGSYYENITSNFERLTDEEWLGSRLSGAVRPLWVNNYLANGHGEANDGEWNLLTGVDDYSQQLAPIVLRVSPNPVSQSAVIEFTLPSSLTGRHVNVSVVDASGAIVSTLKSEPLGTGTYVATWSGSDYLGQSVSSGTYYVRVLVDDAVRTQPIQIVR